MLFLKSWLSDYIDLSDYTNSQLAEIISTKSSEVEEVMEIKDYFDSRVVVGQIKNIRQHPNADRLKVFDVDLGSQGSRQIVSGAGNIIENMLVPVALAGAKLPEITIEPRPLRGEKSEGMCCGKSELALETGYSEGLWNLEEEKQNFSTQNYLGKSVCELLPQYFPKDYIYDISILPNRVGVFGSYLGFALELSTILENKELLTSHARKLLGLKYVIDAVDTVCNSPKQDAPKISFEDNTGITNNFSLFDLDLEKKSFELPHLIKMRMFLTDINIVGNLTDISNYLLYDIGQPTHFFSTNKVAKTGSNSLQWSIRKTNQKVSFAGLGLLKHTSIPADTAVLQNQDGEIIAIPGVSGSDSTKVDQDTRVVVEIANFYHEDIARTSFDLKYRSDGSKVWIGGVNVALGLIALVRLRELLPEAHLGHISSWSRESGNNNLAHIINNIKNYPITLNSQELAKQIDSRPVQEWIGTVEQKLNLIGEYKDGMFKRELFYSNIQDTEDVLEDVIRLIGFNNLKKDSIRPVIHTNQSKAILSSHYLKKIYIKYGLSEVITRPFVAKEELTGPGNALKVTKAASSLNPYVRDSLFPSLLSCLTANTLSGVKKAALFELNKVYSHVGGTLEEKICVDSMSIEDNPYIITSLVHELCRACGSDKPVITTHSNSYGQGYLYTSNKIAIQLIEVANKHKKKYGLPLSKRVYYTHTDLTNWDYTYNKYPTYYDESEYPTITRSYSIEVLKNVQWIGISDILAANNKDYKFDIRITPIERVNKEKLESLLFKAEFVSYECTLSSEDIKSWEDQVIPQIKALTNIL